MTEMIVRRYNNKLREKMGLPLIIYKDTTCPSCQQTFLSKNYPAIRICGKCKDRERTELGIFDCPHKIHSTKFKIPIEINWAELSEEIIEVNTTNE